MASQYKLNETTTLFPIASTEPKSMLRDALSSVSAEVTVSNLNVLLLSNVTCEETASPVSPSVQPVISEQSILNADPLETGIYFILSFDESCKVFAPTVCFYLVSHKLL